LAEPDLDFSRYFLVLGGLVGSHELLVISQKLMINHSTSPKNQGPIVPGLMMYTSKLTIKESKI